MAKAFSSIPRIFLGFLIASLLFWLLMNLSKEYTTEVSFAVNYQNLKQDKYLLTKPQENIELLIKGSGFKLIALSFMKKPIVFDLKNLKLKSNSLYYLLSKNIFTDIQKQLLSGLTLKSFNQDTIFFTISKLLTKKIPVIPDLKITYKKGYDLAKPIEIIPDSMSVFGTEKDLKNINSIGTEKILFNNISDNISQSFRVVEPSKIKLKHKTVRLSISVDKFTEGKIEIPITVVDLPKDKNINIFPKKAVVIYKVGLKNFNAITESSFEVLCNYKESEEHNLPYLIPKLNIKNNKVLSVRLQPDKIDFLIFK
ncbi:MAG: hypothetical protein ACK5H1_03735 [Tenacibaculum sp.]